jgi:2-C-methyl-D-erythritol 2,4-cyclodiphosphate synthase
MLAFRTGIGFDIHRFAPGRRLVLGGVTIDHPVGLDGHSDADVLCHALADAVLGAVADGDIGQHFPNTDPRWRGADSVGLLRAAGRRAAERGYRVVNVDATVIAEGPRVGPHAAAMRANIAGALGIRPEDVSVKATTAETMGALGRREGIAVLAVATLAPGGEEAS